MSEIAALYKTLKSDPVNRTIIERIESEISIVSYQKYWTKGGVSQIKSVRDIFDVIVHYRDASGHKEKTAQDIIKVPNTEQRRYFNTTRIGDEMSINIGAGELLFNNHILRVMKEIYLNFNDHELYKFEVRDRVTDEVMFWDLCRKQDRVSHGILIPAFEIEAESEEGKEINKIRIIDRTTDYFNTLNKGNGN
jgi:hypothetical protein